jgi:hypothetical protein
MSINMTESDAVRLFSLNETFQKVPDSDLLHTVALTASREKFYVILQCVKMSISGLNSF